MLKENNNVIRKIQLASDLCIAVISFLLAYRFRGHGYHILPPVQMGSFSQYSSLLYIILPLWALLFYYNRSHSSIRGNTLFQVVLPVLKTVLIGGVAIMTGLFIFKMGSVSRGFILGFLFIDALLMSAERVAVTLFLRYIRKKGRNYRTLLIIGTDKRAQDFSQMIMEHGEWGLKISGFVDIEPQMVGRNILGRKVIGLIDELPEILMKHQVDEIVCVSPRAWYDLLDKVAMTCETLGIKMKMACDFYSTKSSKFQLDNIANWQFLTLSPPPHYGEMLTVKRAIDIVFSSAFLFLVSPALLLIVLGIKLTSPGPVFFMQKRTGLTGRRFMMYKFRTMVDGADRIKDDLRHMNEMSGPVFKVRNDPRITVLGKLLRKFSLDEVPQFINVLKGDMSIVGPRPPIASEVDQYSFNQRRRLSVKPGITCLWQINGRNKIGFSEWVKLDLEYIDKWSIGLDLKIIVKTVPAVLKGTGY